MPHTQSLMSQQRVPSWFPGLKRPAKAPLPAPSAQRQRSIDQGLQRGVRGPRQSFPVLTSQEVNTTISVALRHFGLSWEALDVAQLGTIREAARSVSDMEGGAFPEQLHAAILGTLRQRREQPVLIDTTPFVDAAHANSRARAEPGIYGGITINGGHRDRNGTLLHYLEQGPAWCSALHACNAMVGAPVLALADIGVHEVVKQAPGMYVSHEAVQQAVARMRENGVPLFSVLEVLQNKLGIATHVYQHIPVVEDDGSSGFNHAQAGLLDKIDARQLLLEMTTPSGAKLCAAFHKDGADWTQQDVVKGETTPFFSPSLYLRMEEATGFTAAWLRQGLSASEGAALSLGPEAGALRLDPAALAARLGLEDVSKLHDVISEWNPEEQKWCLYLPKENSDSSARVQELRELDIPEAADRQLHEALRAYQSQRQSGKQAMPVDPTPIPPSPATPPRSTSPLHPLQGQWRKQRRGRPRRQPQQAVGPETRARYSAEALGPAMHAWSEALKELKEAEPLSPDDRKVFLAEARSKWLDSATAEDPKPWETWPVLGMKDGGAEWVVTGHDKPIPYDPGNEFSKIAAWKKAVVLSQEALDTAKPDRFKKGWAPPLKVKGIKKTADQSWRIYNRVEGMVQNPSVYFGGRKDDLTEDQAWRKALEMLADIKGPRTARPLPRADLPTTMQQAMLVWEKDLAAINNLDESSDEKAKKLADARRKWLQSVTEGETEPWKKWKVKGVSFDEGTHRWVVGLTHKEKRHRRYFHAQWDLSGKVEQWIKAVIQAQAFSDTFESEQALTLWGSWVPPVTLHHLDLDTNEPRWIATLESGRKEPVSFQDRNNREKEEAWHGAFRTLTEGNAQAAPAPQAGSSRQADPDND